MQKQAGGIKARIPTPDQVTMPWVKHRDIGEGKKVLRMGWNLHKRVGI